MAEGLGGATEHQGDDTPHFHGIMAISTPYQMKTLVEIKDLILKDLNEVDRIKEFIAHMCREDHFDDAGHQSQLGQLEKEWAANQAGVAHLRMAMKPSFLRAPTYGHGPSSLWEKSCEEVSKGTREAETMADAHEYKQRYEEDAQYIFSRVQHHWHAYRNGVRVPYPYCRKKGVVKKKASKEKRGTLYVNKIFRNSIN